MIQRNCGIVDDMDGISHSVQKGLIRMSAIKPVSQARWRYAKNNFDCDLKNLHAMILFLKLIIEKSDGLNLRATPRIINPNQQFLPLHQ